MIFKSKEELKRYEEKKNRKRKAEWNNGPPPISVLEVASNIRRKKERNKVPKNLDDGKNNKLGGSILSPNAGGKNTMN